MSDLIAIGVLRDARVPFAAQPKYELRLRAIEARVADMLPRRPEGPVICGLSKTQFEELRQLGVDTVCVWRVETLLDGEPLAIATPWTVARDFAEAKHAMASCLRAVTGRLARHAAKAQRLECDR